MEYELVQEVLNVAANITEGETEHMRYDLDWCDSLQGVKRVFTDNGIRWVDIVEDEVARVLQGAPPIYFVPSSEYAEHYRFRRGIRLQALPSRGLRHVKEIGRDVNAHLEALKVQKETLGVTLADYAFGFACPAEMQEFYNSEEWKRKAKVTRYLRDYKCTSCQRTGVLLHAHHETPIISAYTFEFDVVFSDGRLRTLCEDCHRKFHSRTVRGFGRHYVFTDAEEVKQEKQDLRLLRAAHDRLKICPHCYGYRPDWQQQYTLWGLSSSAVSTDVDFYGQGA